LRPNKSEKPARRPRAWWQTGSGRRSRIRAVHLGGNPISPHGCTAMPAHGTDALPEGGSALSPALVLLWRAGVGHFSSAAKIAIPHPTTRRGDARPVNGQRICSRLLGRQVPDEMLLDDVDPSRLSWPRRDRAWGYLSSWFGAGSIRGHALKGQGFSLRSWADCRCGG
jgi:hypothetical protein